MSLYSLRSWFLFDEKFANIAHLLTNCQHIQFWSSSFRAFDRYCNNIAISFAMNKSRLLYQRGTYNGGLQKHEAGQTFRPWRHQMTVRSLSDNVCVCVCSVLAPSLNVTETWSARDIQRKRKRSPRMSCLSLQLAQTIQPLIGFAVLCVPISNPACVFCVFLWCFRTCFNVALLDFPFFFSSLGFVGLNVHAWSGSRTNAQNCEEPTGWTALPQNAKPIICKMKVEKKKIKGGKKIRRKEGGKKKCVRGREGL